jgi:general secretion pathway protein L
MARIVGLDLGSKSVKALVLESTMRGTAVKQYLSAPMPSEGDRLERFRTALTSLQQQGLSAVDSVVVAVPGATLATHAVSMPFSDAKKIEATLGFEVEGQLPYDLSEAVYDYQVASAEENGAQLLVGVTKKDELAALLALLKEFKLDPRVVTHAGLAYQNVLASREAQDADAPEVAVLDIGHERVSIAIGKSGGLAEYTRAFPGGGLALSKALAKEFGIGLDKAEGWKEQYGALASAVVGPDAERAARAFIKALQPVMRELRPSLKAYTAKSKRPVGQLLLCGGTAKLAGLAEYIQNELGVPCSLLDLPDDALMAEAGPAAAQAWALALRGAATGNKAPRFNLRRGDLAFKSDFDFVKARLGQLAAFAAILLALLVASGIVRNAILERRVKVLDGVLCDTTQRVLGTCERDYDRALSMMAGKESPVAGIPKQSAATLLAEVVQRVPPEMKVQFEQVVVDLDRIQLRCEADSSKTVEDLMASLKTFKCFKEVTEGKLEKNKDGTKVSVRLDVQVECPDSKPEGT